MGSRARKTVGMGAVRKSSRQHSDPEINRIIDDVYKELNKLSISVNLKASANTSSHSEGSSGDIRLFKWAGQDGSVGYFIQGKFGDGWGTARLSLEHKNPEVSELGGGNTTVGGGVPFSAWDGVGKLAFDSQWVKQWLYAMRGSDLRVIAKKVWCVARSRWRWLLFGKVFASMDWSCQA